MQKQPVEFDGFDTYGYMLSSLGYTVEYWIHQNQAKPGKTRRRVLEGFGVARVDKC